MAPSDDLVNSGDVGFPRVAFVLQKRTAFCGQAIVAPARTCAMLHPAPFDQSFFLEPAQNRIQRTDPELQPAAGSTLDQLSDFVAVTVSFFEQRKNEKLGTPLFEFAVEHDCETILVRSITSSSIHTNVAASGNFHCFPRPTCGRLDGRFFRSVAFN